MDKASATVFGFDEKQVIGFGIGQGKSGASELREKLALASISDLPNLTHN